MSTRATIKIESKKRKRIIRLYHHCDGYPEGVGYTLTQYVSRLEPNFWNVEDITNDLVKNNGINDNGFEVTCKIHGDEEYFYLIDCDNEELKCYRMEWNELQEEDIIKPEREIEL